MKLNIALLVLVVLIIALSLANVAGAQSPTPSEVPSADSPIHRYWTPPSYAHVIAGGTFDKSGMLSIRLSDNRQLSSLCYVRLPYTPAYSGGESYLKPYWDNTNSFVDLGYSVNVVRGSWDGNGLTYIEVQDGLDGTIRQFFLTCSFENSVATPSATIDNAAPVGSPGSWYPPIDYLAGRTPVPGITPTTPQPIVTVAPAPIVSPIASEQLITTIEQARQYLAQYPPVSAPSLENIPVEYAPYSPCSQPGLNEPLASAGMKNVLVTICVNADTKEVTSYWTSMATYYPNLTTPNIRAWSNRGTSNAMMVGPVYLAVRSLFGIIYNNLVTMNEISMGETLTTEVFESRTALEIMARMSTGLRFYITQSKTAFINWLDEMTIMCVNNAKTSRSAVIQTKWRTMAAQMQAIASQLGGMP